MAPMLTTCSKCGTDGHTSSCICSEANGGGGDGGAVTNNDGVGGKSIMLFGVRVMEASFRKSASMNNLAQYEQPQDSNPDVAAGYASDDVVHASARGRERKRGVAWTEEEHRRFLIGLQKVGKGDWRGISRNFVKTRTPTQVASHAQKYFLRRNNHNRRRRRSSLFDITTHDTFMGNTMEGYHVPQESTPQITAVNLSPVALPLPLPRQKSIENLTLGQTNLIRPIPIFSVPPTSRMADLKLNSSSITEDQPTLPLSLNLSTTESTSPSSSSSNQQPPPARHVSSYKGMTGGFNSSSGDNKIISVA